MATTTNYSWTTPDDTSLVKDGASAIRALGTAIDTSMNTALGTKKAGMVLLNTTSFSGVASISLPADTFTSTYDNYKIIGRFSNATTGTVSARMRAAGSDNTTSNYTRKTIFNYDTTVGAESATTTSWNLGDTMATGIITFTLDVFAPKLSEKTEILVRDMTDQSQGGGPGLVNRSIGLWFITTTSFDAISFFAAGNITGKIMAYGYNQQEK